MGAEFHRVFMRCSEPMAVTISGVIVFPADREVVWAKLNDPEVLKTCIPGCQTLEKVGNATFAGIVKVKVGPITATFKTNVTLDDLDPPKGYRINGEGEGGISGFARGGITVALKESPVGESACILTYEASADVGGKIAQLGTRMIYGVAKKIADQFFAALAAVVSAAPAGTAQEE